MYASSAVSSGDPAIVVLKGAIRENFRSGLHRGECHTHIVTDLVTVLKHQDADSTYNLGITIEGA